MKFCLRPEATFADFREWLSDRDLRLTTHTMWLSDARLKVPATTTFLAFQTDDPITAVEFKLTFSDLILFRVMGAT